MTIRCPMTGKTFSPSEQEMSLRKKLGIEGNPAFFPAFRFLQLGAFWQHWTLHKRQDDRTKKNIVSVFGADCPYPVWHKDEWIKHSNPPGADFDSSREVFPQLWEFFQTSPIAHNVGTGNENCEYTDDWWYSKNCYLSHSGIQCENLKYCYRIFIGKDSQFCVFSSNLELCVDVINSKNCYNVRYALNSQDCRDSAFLFDCRNTKDSLFCWNLRNKQYCYFNEQLTKEEFEAKKQEWDFNSRKVYEQGKQEFIKILREKAWLRPTQINLTEQSTGDYMDGCKHLENCYFLSDSEDSVNCMRAAWLKDCLDCVGDFKGELLYYTSLVQDQCYDVKFSYNLMQCKFAEYSAHCFQSEHLFGCAGLVGKKYYIFNKPYSPEEYHVLKNKIIDHMKSTGEYGQFFPGYFAANPYEESLSSFYFPLDQETAKKFGFRVRQQEEQRQSNYLTSEDVPDRSDEANENLAEKIFWDSESGRPFQIQKDDVEFCKKLEVPLTNTYYMKRIQENFRWLPFQGMTRSAVCANCARPTQTSWPKEYEQRIVCEECYLKKIL